MAMTSLLDGLRAYLRPAPALPAVAHVLRSHFKKSGIEVEPRSLKPTKPGLSAVFDLKIANHPLPVLVLLCADAASAERFVYDGGDRARSFPRKNGRLVMYLPYWEEEDSLTARVIAAFESFTSE
jgi:hypothetical protein